MMKKPSHSTIVPHSQDTNVLPHKSLIAKKSEISQCLCFIPILPYIIVFTQRSIIYKHTKHSSLDSQLVLISKMPPKSTELQRIAPEKDLSPPVPEDPFPLHSTHWEGKDKTQFW